MKAPKSVTNIKSKLTAEHLALQSDVVSAKGRDAYEAARLAYNSKLTADFGDEANSILVVAYENLPFAK